MNNDIKDVVRYGYYVLSLAFAIILTYEVFTQRIERQRMHETEVAYQSATQNVTNRLIGRLEGAGEKRVAQILATWQDEVKIEKAKAKKELGEF